MYHWDETYSYGDYYIWEDADGTKHYFREDTNGDYKDEDGLELTLTDTGTGTQKYCITDKNGNCSYFDTNGRLTQQTNNQATEKSITITYTSDTGMLISSIKDGANRTYSFTYSDGLLSKITYTGTGTSEVSKVTFTYDGNSNLISITDKDGKSSTYTYDANHLLSSAKDIDGYKLAYTYTSTEVGKPNRVASVTEYSGTTIGGAISISYAHNQTEFTDHNGNVQIVQFNDWGNTVSIQDDQGRAQYAQYAINNAITENSTQTTAADSTAKGNQLRLASKLQNTVGNILQGTSFESSTAWTVTGNTVSRAVSSDAAYLGSKSLKLTHSTAGTAAGVYSPSFTVGAGETYTFSAYVKTGTGTAYLALHDGSATTVSETLAANSDWMRLEVSYTNTSSAAKAVTARLLTTAAGTTYMDCVQVEKSPTASRYNILENGNFTYSSGGWTFDNGRTSVQTEDKAPAPQLDTWVYSMTGDPSGTKRIFQTVNVSGEEGDTFILAGWAKGDSVPLTNAGRKFSIIASFKKDGATVDIAELKFNPCVDVWQYAASPIVSQEDFDCITIELSYNRNANTVLFDGIQLFKEEFGNSYTYDEEGNLISVVDLQKQTTSYEYDDDSNLTQIIQDNKAKMTYTYDDHHNVLTATSSEGTCYSFEYDQYGNNTKVTSVSGSTSITSSAEYTADGNRLQSTTDAAGNKTTYGYSSVTNALIWVQYPEDTNATRTNYTYDSMYRMATATATSDTGANFSASYTYTNDLLTSLQTPTTKYDFAYGAFSLRSSIKIGTRTLAAYTYTNDRNNYLKTLAYGNNDSVQYTYDNQGRVIRQTYEDSAYVSYQYNNSGDLATTYDSASGIKTTYYYDTTGRLMRYMEQGSDDSRHIVRYMYDNINNLTSQVEIINGTAHQTNYTYDDDNRVTSSTVGNLSRSFSYDGFGRLITRNTTKGDTTVLAQRLFYRKPATGTTTGQVGSIKYTYGGTEMTLTYGYDKNGNITSVSDGTNTTRYYYDSANQLLRENNKAANKTWVWTYDNAGNITSRKEYAYTTGTPGTPTSTVNYAYDDSAWGDLLTGYGNYTITSDAIGNPTLVKQGNTTIRTYSWRNGRELASMTSGGNTWTFTYNADGIRTKRVSGGATYTYVYNGGSLSQMNVGSDTLYFIYDASGTPTAVVYNGTTYYYQTNLQGDVIAILNGSGAKVVEYTYDAWGKVLTRSGSMASTLGSRNPLRYRGYVYDAETQLYYLQSRYYDPEMGRFINADAFTSTGQGLLSNNMFAYCQNNAINFTDSSGNMCIPCNPLRGGPAGLVVPDSGGIPPSCDKRIKKKVNDFLNNDREQAVIDAKRFAFYKGTPVIIVPGNNAFSCGIIFFGDEIINQEVVRHEYGHTLQLKNTGISTYFKTVIVPSVIGFWLTEAGELDKEYYYSLPWEYIADELGKANNVHQPWAETVGNLYWIFVESMY